MSKPDAAKGSTRWPSGFMGVMFDSGVLKRGDSSPEDGKISVELRERIRRSLPSGGGGNSDLMEYVEDDGLRPNFSRKDRRRLASELGTWRRC
jgi:hypothetical protein